MPVVGFLKGWSGPIILLCTTISHWFLLDLIEIDLNWAGFKNRCGDIFTTIFFLNCCNFLRSGYTCRISIYISNEFKNQEWNFINATISTCSMYCTIIKEWQSWQIMEALEKIKDIIYSYFKNEHCLKFAIMVY